MVALNCWVPAGARRAVAGESEMSPTATVAFALLVASAALVAVTVCVPAADGAVYKPAALIVPVVELPPLALSTAHVTAVLLEPETVAVNCVVSLTPTFTEDWFNVTATVAGGGVDELLVPPQPVSVIAINNARR